MLECCSISCALTSFWLRTSSSCGEHTWPANARVAASCKPEASIGAAAGASEESRHWPSAKWRWPPRVHGAMHRPCWILGCQHPGCGPAQRQCREVSGAHGGLLSILFCLTWPLQVSSSLHSGTKSRANIPCSWFPPSVQTDCCCGKVSHLVGFGFCLLHVLYLGCDRMCALKYDVVNVLDFEKQGRCARWWSRDLS